MGFWDDLKAGWDAGTANQPSGPVPADRCAREHQWALQAGVREKVLLSPEELRAFLQRNRTSALLAVDHRHDIAEKNYLRRLESIETTIAGRMPVLVFLFGDGDLFSIDPQEKAVLSGLISSVDSGHQIDLEDPSGISGFEILLDGARARSVFVPPFFGQDEQRERWLRHAMQSAGQSGSGAEHAAPPPPGDPWAVLGVTRGASDADIKRAYRDLSAKYHPDKVSHLGKELQDLAHRKLVEINAAHDALKQK